MDPNCGSLWDNSVYFYLPISIEGIDLKIDEDNEDGNLIAILGKFVYMKKENTMDSKKPLIVLKYG